MHQGNAECHLGAARTREGLAYCEELLVLSSTVMLAADGTEQRPTYSCLIDPRNPSILIHESVPQDLEVHRWPAKRRKPQVPEIDHHLSEARQQLVRIGLVRARTLDARAPEGIEDG